jgi:hypothetical protein
MMERITMPNAAARLRTRRLLRLSLSLAATLLLADAGSAKSNHGSSAGGAAASSQAGPVVRRCDPPPCPAKPAVKSQQPPSVWSGSTKPTEGNTTNKGGPIH